MMNVGLVLPADSWCRLFTAGIFLPSLGALRPSGQQDQAVADADQAAARRRGPRGRSRGA